MMTVCVSYRFILSFKNIKQNKQHRQGEGERDGGGGGGRGGGNQALCLYIFQKNLWKLINVTVDL